MLSHLAAKTVIYVTHQVEFLPSADLVLVSNVFYFFSSEKKKRAPFYQNYQRCAPFFKIRFLLNVIIEKWYLSMILKSDTLFVFCQKGPFDISFFFFLSTCFFNYYMNPLYHNKFLLFEFLVHEKWKDCTIWKLF